MKKENNSSVLPDSSQIGEIIESNRINTDLELQSFDLKNQDESKLLEERKINPYSNRHFGNNLVCCFRNNEPALVIGPHCKIKQRNFFYCSFNKFRVFFFHNDNWIFCWGNFFGELCSLLSFDENLLVDISGDICSCFKLHYGNNCEPRDLLNITNV